MAEGGDQQRPAGTETAMRLTGRRPDDAVGCIIDAVVRLDERQRDALRLASVDHLGCTEIAARMGTTRREVALALSAAMNAVTMAYGLASAVGPRTRQ